MKNMLILAMFIAVGFFFMTESDAKRDFITFLLDTEENLMGDAQSRPLATDIAELTFGEYPRATFSHRSAAFVGTNRQILGCADADTAANQAAITALYQTAYDEALERNTRRIADYWRWHYEADELAEIRDYFGALGWSKFGSLCEIALLSTAAAAASDTGFPEDFTSSDIALTRTFGATQAGERLLKSCGPLASTYAAARDAFDRRTESETRRQAGDWMRKIGLKLSPEAQKLATAEPGSGFKPVAVKLKSRSD